MVHCYVCGQEIGFLGWANHVKMEKRIHGDDIYIRLKQERTNGGYLDLLPKEQRDKNQKQLDEFQRGRK